MTSATGDSAGTSVPAVLEGTWVVESLAPTDDLDTSDLDTGDPEVQPRLTLEEGQARGTGGVNRFRTTYEVTVEGALSFGPIAATRMAGPEGAMRREVGFFTALRLATTVVVAYDRLVLRDGEDRILVVLARA